MSTHERDERPARWAWSVRAVAWVTFIVAALVCSAGAAWLESRRIALERAQFDLQVGDMARSVEGQVDRALSATYALAAMVRQAQGAMRDFDAVAAAMLPFYPGADSLQLAPNGVVQFIVPLAGNERAIGHDLLADRQRTREAFLARDTGRLTLAGPFELVQGGLGAVGRLPVFLDSPAGPPRFWGFTSVLIRFPSLLEATGLARLADRGIDYELWRVHPDTGARQRIAGSTTAALVDPVTKSLRMPNGVWSLSARPHAGWTDLGRLALYAGIGLLISLMAARLSRQMAELRQHRNGLQELVRRRTVELEARQGELAQAQAVARTGSWVFEPSSGRLHASPVTRCIFGFADDVELGRGDFEARIGAADRARVRDAWHDLLEGRRLEVEYCIDVGGQPRCVREQAEVQRDEQGRIVRAIGAVQDISAMRHAQRQLLRLRAAVEQSPVSIILTDAAANIEYVNPRFEQVTGYRAEEAVGRNPRFLRAGRRSPVDYSAMWARLVGGRTWSGEFENRRKDGSALFEATSISPILDDAGTITGYVAVKEDVTERRQVELRMREAMVVFNASSQAIMITDAQGIITSVNPACCTTTGYSAAELIGRTPGILRSGRHDEVFYSTMWEHLAATGHWEGEIWNRRKDGQSYLQWITISAVHDEQGRRIKFVSHASDITQRKQREEVIWRQANFDGLTGLANRHLLHDRLRQTLAQARRSGHRAGLMFLDLDGFKWINDTLGHDTGDELLVEVAQRLQSCVRDQDTVARMGGDEFTVVVSDLNQAADLRMVADKVLRALAEPFVLGSSSHQVSGSIGLTVYPDDGADIQSLFRNADVAMYEAKLLGKNRCEFYAEHMRERARHRMELETELRAAVQRGEFELHYQPIVRAVDEALVGAEALLRWKHPQRGCVAPGEFIAVAEETGLIVPIGNWVLREAATQLARWRDQRPGLHMAVNVSGVQYREAGLPELIRQLCADRGLDRSHLMLEITESVLMQGGSATENCIREISADGVPLALDDFGTGFSSLSYLKRFPVAVVKIDRGFVADCARGGSDGRLVEAIIQMAHSLDLIVTAEGVETGEQAQFLKAHGCDFLQGYLFGKPVPAAEFERFITPRTLPVTSAPERADAAAPV